jgi:hypothetical protein
MIAVNSLTAFALFFVLLRRGAVNRVAALFFLMPPVTALIDYLVLGDRLTPFKVAGIAAAAFGVYLATRQGATAPAQARSPEVRSLPRPAAAARGRAVSYRAVSAPPAAARRSCPAPCK